MQKLSGKRTGSGRSSVECGSPHAEGATCESRESLRFLAEAQTAYGLFVPFCAFWGGLAMIITKKKPVDELLGMLAGFQKLAIVGCGNCAAACQTGGQKEIDALKALLEERGFEVVATVLPEECCHKMLVKKDTKALRDCGAEAVVGMACGDGVQTVADNLALPVYPANNTMFLGQIERVGIFHEYCRMCGDCVLGSTGGICPVTQCAKSLINGPCGGQKNGKCEVDPNNDCAWIRIYRRLESLGRLKDLTNTRPDKGYREVYYPRHINLREK